MWVRWRGPVSKAGGVRCGAAVQLRCGVPREKTGNKGREKGFLRATSHKRVPGIHALSSFRHSRGTIFFVKRFRFFFSSWAEVTSFVDKHHRHHHPHPRIPPEVRTGTLLVCLPSPPSLALACTSSLYVNDSILLPGFTTPP